MGGGGVPFAHAGSQSPFQRSGLGPRLSHTQAGTVSGNGLQRAPGIMAVLQSDFCCTVGDSSPRFFFFFFSHADQLLSNL